MSAEKYYFHADLDKYTDRLRHILIIVIIPIIALCVFCTVNIVLRFNSPLAVLLFAVIVGSVLFGILFTFFTVYLIDKLSRRHARYTFLDIIPSAVIYSEYAGEFVRYGERIILRRLYIIPFAALESVSRNPKEASHNITFKGKIRAYFLETDRLGYHVDSDGNIELDTGILNYGYFTELNEITVKNRLGNTKRLERSVLYYWEEFKNAPEKKPFDISQFVRARQKPKPKTSNPALEAPSFTRNWK